MDKSRPVLLSGIQPTGNLTVANYLGAIRNWVALQDDYDCLFILVDMHALTVQQDPAALRERGYDFLSLYMACGVDPDRHAVFVQSHVQAHAQLTWVLNCFSYMGELRRMTQFKEKAVRQGRNVRVGLFDYPVLMAADILLYGTNLVPIGDDQRQHLELAREIARRFNGQFGDVFTVPEALIPAAGGRIMSLLEPANKMSKTDDNANNYIALLDDADTVRRKIRQAVTDSGRTIECDPARPAITNLVSLFACISNETPEDMEQRFKGKGYAEFKVELTDALVAFLEPIQVRYRDIRHDQMLMADILRRGVEVARVRAAPMIERVHDVVGFIPMT